MPLNPNALVTLADLKERLSPSGDIGVLQDAYYENVINRVSQFFETYCSRIFRLLTHYEQVVTRSIAGRYRVHNPPIQLLRGFHIALVPGLTITGPDNSTFAVSGERVVLTSGATVQIYPFTTSPTVGVLAANITAGLVWTATSEIEPTTPSQFLLKRSYVAGQQLLAFDPKQQFGVLRYTNTEIYLPERHRMCVDGALIVYDGGYDPIPDDLRHACLELCVEIINTWRDKADEALIDGTALIRRAAYYLHPYRRINL